jgi:hypothetical protein
MQYSLRYLVRLDNEERLKPQQVRQISSEFGEMAKRFAVSIKNLRISELAIEFDLFANELDRKTRAIEALVSKYGQLLSERNLSEEIVVSRDKREIMKVVVELFNEQRYWECHEVMEFIWRKEKIATEKDLQNGVILAVSALVHIQKGEDDVCFGMIPRTLEKLARWKNRDYYGLDVDSLGNYLEDIIATHDIKFQKI